MKKLNLLLGILIGLTILSCSTDEKNDNPELSMAELLIQNSPWAFDHYELINIIDAGNSDFTQTDIENDVNSRENSTILTFNQNGIGFVSISGGGTVNWNWEIINGNQLKLIHNEANSSILENLSVSSTQLIFDVESVTYDQNVHYEVLHNGKYFYE